jgi:hypothetical protein
MTATVPRTEAQQRRLRKTDVLYAPNTLYCLFPCQSLHPKGQCNYRVAADVVSGEPAREENYSVPVRTTASRSLFPADPGCWMAGSVAIKGIWTLETGRCHFTSMVSTSTPPSPRQGMRGHKPIYCGLEWGLEHWIPWTLDTGCNVVRYRHRTQVRDL